MRITEWLKILSTENGSDLYLSTGAPPCAKFQGQLKPIASEIMQPGEIKDIANEIMDPIQQAEGFATEGFQIDLNGRKLAFRKPQAHQGQVTRHLDTEAPASLGNR